MAQSRGNTTVVTHAHFDDLWTINSPSFIHLTAPLLTYVFPCALRELCGKSFSIHPVDPNQSCYPVKPFLVYGTNGFTNHFKTRANSIRYALPRTRNDPEIETSPCPCGAKPMSIAPRTGAPLHAQNPVRNPGELASANESLNPKLRYRQPSPPTKMKIATDKVPSLTPDL
jgi:hypothetical protein